MKTYTTKVMIILILFFQLKITTAQYDSFHIKEQYDQRQKTLIQNGSYNPCNVGTNYIDITNYYGDIMPYVLESYIRMYETTKDKAYLIKFILDAICMHEHRRDELDIDPDPTWAAKTYCNNGPCMYHDGSIIWAMSHFVYLIFGKYDEPRPAEFGFPLPQLDNTKITDNNFNKTWSTYGDFANWLRIRTEETLDYYTYGANAYWADDTRCYAPTPNPDNNTFAQILNQQAGFASALFYLGIVDPNTDYLHKAAQIAKAYKSTVADQSGCWYDGWNWHGTGYNDIRFVTEFQTVKNAYIWKSYGWRSETCTEQKKTTHDDYEDISHAIQTLRFPKAINNKLQSQGIMLFNDYDMQRYSNTFAENIFGQYVGNNPNIHAGIDGDDIIEYRVNNGIHDYDGINNPILKQTALAWMPFYKYNTASPPYDVYNIIMNLYVSNYSDNPQSIIFGNSYYGLSEVVAAQWDKECVNLTLYNRDVVYNQDFEAKNELVVAPQESDNNYVAGTDEPFAEPKNFTDGLANNRFVIESGKTVNMVAGEKIVLKAGFHAKAGSHFRASISTTCTGSSKVPLITDNFTNDNNFKNSKIEHPKPDTLKFNNYDIFSIAAYPNPFNNTTTIEYNIPYSTDVNISIFDIYGTKIMQPINQYLEKGEHSNTINMSHISKGIYYCKLKSGNQSKTIKLVLSN